MGLSLSRAVDDLGYAAEEPYAKALQDVARRVRDACSPVQFLRWADAVRDYLASQMWESAHRGEERFPGTASGCGNPPAPA
ncbi:terpene synthase family protein [Streptomyces sp. NPDC002537]